MNVSRSEPGLLLAAGIATIALLWSPAVSGQASKNRPVIAGCPAAGGSNTPTDVKNSSLPMCTLSACVPTCGCAVETSVDTTFSVDCVKSITETSRET